jgi:hypothetical protein
MPSAQSAPSDSRNFPTAPRVHPAPNEFSHFSTLSINCFRDRHVLNQSGCVSKKQQLLICIKYKTSSSASFFPANEKYLCVSKLAIGISDTPLNQGLTNYEIHRHKHTEEILNLRSLVGWKMLGKFAGRCLRVRRSKPQLIKQCSHSQNTRSKTGVKIV